MECTMQILTNKRRGMLIAVFLLILVCCSVSGCPEEDKGSGDNVLECTETLFETDGDRFSVIGKPVAANPGILNSQLSHSTVNKWRIKACPEHKIYLLLSTSLTEEDYIQLNRNVYYGSTCSPHPVYFEFSTAKTVLVGLLDSNKSSSFQLGIICPASAFLRLSKQLLECKEVADYAMSSNDAFESLQLIASGALVYNDLYPGKHVCKILHLAADNCEFNYNKVCILS